MQPGPGKYALVLTTAMKPVGAFDHICMKKARYKFLIIIIKIRPGLSL